MRREEATRYEAIRSSGTLLFPEAFIIIVVFLCYIDTTRHPLRSYYGGSPVVAHEKEATLG